MSNTNDFSKCKVGDKLWCIQLGECTVDEISDHLVTVYSNGALSSFFLNGFALAHDVHQSLFFAEPHIIAPPEPVRLPEITVGTLLEVWDNGMTWRRAGRFVEWNGEKVMAQVGNAEATWDNWELAPETIRIRELEAAIKEAVVLVDIAVASNYISDLPKAADILHAVIGGKPE